MIIRDLRLGGACLPVTGDFISLDGTNTGQTDEIITRTGLTRPDLSCIRTSVPTTFTVVKDGGVVPVSNSEGFSAGMHAYIRHPDGEGEYFDVSSVISPTKLGKSQTLSRDYPAAACTRSTSAVSSSERRRRTACRSSVVGSQARSRSRSVSSSASVSAAAQLPAVRRRGYPANNAEWSVVEQVLPTSPLAPRTRPEWGYYRRSISVW
jgi:hypothetical protein